MDQGIYPGKVRSFATTRQAFDPIVVGIAILNARFHSSTQPIPQHGTGCEGNDSLWIWFCFCNFREEIYICLAGSTACYVFKIPTLRLGGQIGFIGVKRLVEIEGDLIRWSLFFEGSFVKTSEYFDGPWHVASNVLHDVLPKQQSIQITFTCPLNKWRCPDPMRNVRGSVP